MAKLEYRTHRHREPYNGKEIKGESLTQSGRALTIQQVLAKHKAGMHMPDAGDGVYFDEEDLSKVNKFFAPHKLDLTDIDELNRRAADAKEVLEKVAERKKEAEKQAAEEQKFQDRLKQEKEKEKDKKTEKKQVEFEE